MREQYWTMYFSLKHRACYYKYFLILFSRINRCISTFCTLLSLSFVAAWGIWDQHPVVWSVLICTSQIIQAVFPQMPYNDLLTSSKFIIPEMDKLLLSIRHEWLEMNYVDEYSDKQISELIHKYEEQYSNLVLQFFSAAFVPSIKWCEVRAEQECKIYFQNTYASGEEVT